MAATETRKRRAPKAEEPPAEEPTPAPSAPTEPAPPSEPAPEPGPDWPAPGDGEPGDDEAPDAAPTALVVTCPHCESQFTLAPPIDAFFPKQLDQYQTCDNCEGRGKGTTGSRVEEFIEDECPVCKGKGFVSVETGRGITAPPEEAPPWPNAQWDSERGLWI